METKLLTKKELAERWQVSERSIDQWLKDGIIQKAKGIPTVIRFHPDHIAQLEGTKLERFSPIEKKRLELEIEKLKKENEELKEVTRAVFQQASRVMGI